LTRTPGMFSHYCIIKLIFGFVWDKIRKNN
jgi:hypothetical protein